MKFLRRLPLLTLSFILSLTLIPTPNTSAQIACDPEFLSLSNVYFYDPCDTTTLCEDDDPSLTVRGNSDYAGKQILTSAQLKTIEENKPFYEMAANSTGIPWQMLAAIHIRETNLKRNGPANGQGPYQIVSGDYKVGEYTDDEFQLATLKAAEFIKNKAGSRSLNDINNIKYTFFAYNGMAGVYKQQALNLGFDSAGAGIGEGSPYVMNRYDAKRDPTTEAVKNNKTWGQIKTDGGSLEYPANTSHYGAFVYYSALALKACNPGMNGDPQAILKSFNDYMSANNESVFGYRLGYNGCTTLTAWYITQHTTLQYGHGHGKDVAGNLALRNKEITVSDTPVPMAIFSVAGGMAAWGSSGNQYGHTGLVISVDEVKKEATVLDTWSGMGGKSSKATIKKFSYPNSRVSFVHIGEHIK